MDEKNIFKLIEIENNAHNNTCGLSIGINIKIGKTDLDCPVTQVCYTEQELIEEAKIIQKDMDKILEDAEDRFNKGGSGYKVSISPGMKPSDIWSELEKIEDEGLFVEQFNVLDEENREAVAEHVLTQCNVFSGKGAIFSKRYNQGTKYIE
jgi:hypothetical protein